MTAPDVNADVRARFEASMREMWGDDDFNPARHPETPDAYRYIPEQSAWEGYRAAHADLSGDVRELVESGNRSIVAFEALGKAFGVIATARARQECEAALVAQKAALAKHTHQEKP